MDKDDRHNDNDDEAVGHSVPKMRSVFITRTQSANSMTQLAHERDSVHCRVSGGLQPCNIENSVSMSKNNLKILDYESTDSETTATLLEEDVPVVSIYDHVVVGRNALSVELSFEVIQLRVTNFLRMKSIAYKILKEDCCISCHTECLMTFTISFWKEVSETASIFQPDAYVVEVQRMRGCPVVLQCVRKCIFFAIRTGEVPTKALSPQKRAPRSVSERIKRIYNLHHGNKQIDMGDAAEFCPMHACKEDISRCKELLKSKKVEQNRLGMEGLVRLTDPCSTSSTACECAACAIVFGEDANGTILQDEILHVLKQRKPWSSAFNEDDNITLDEMKHLALQALQNALHVVALSSIPRTCNFDLENSSFLRLLLRTLRDILTEIDQNPQEAALILRCINELIRLAPITAPSTLVRGDADVHKVYHAQAVGKAHHLGLERESRLLIGQLENAAQGII